MALTFSLEDVVNGRGYALVIRPFLSGRDHHGLHHENPGFQFDADASNGTVRFQPYHDLPSVSCLTNGAYRYDPLWYRNVLYEVERERGLDHLEDWASPGELRFDLRKEDAVVLLSSDPAALDGSSATEPAREIKSTGA